MTQRNVEFQRQAAASQAYGQARYSNVNRTAYVVLALFMGGIGVHDFYAKRNGSGAFLLGLGLLNNVLIYVGGVAQALPVVVIGLVGVAVLWIRIIVEIVTVTEDGSGYPMS